MKSRWNISFVNQFLKYWLRVKSENNEIKFGGFSFWGNDSERGKLVGSWANRWISAGHSWTLLSFHSLYYSFQILHFLLCSNPSLNIESTTTTNMDFLFFKGTNQVSNYFLRFFCSTFSQIELYLIKKY